MVYSTNLDAARRACDRRMVTFAHTAPDCAEIMWNEQNWTLVAMPIASTRAQWDEGLRTVRQFNDLLRVLPPLPPSPERTGRGVAECGAQPSAGSGLGGPNRRAPPRTDVAGSAADAGRRATEPVRRDERSHPTTFGARRRRPQRQSAGHCRAH